MQSRENCHHIFFTTSNSKGYFFLEYFSYLLLVLVQLLKIVCAHAGDALRLSLVTMLLITEHANLELGAGDVLQPNLKKENI